MPSDYKYKIPTTPGSACKKGTPGCRPAPQRDGESDADYAKRTANWQRSYDRRGGVRFGEMSGEQRRAFLKAGGKQSALKTGVQNYIKKHRQAPAPGTTPPANPPGGNNPDRPPVDKGGNYGASAGRSPSGLSREQRQQIVVRRRMAAAKKALGGK